MNRWRTRPIRSSALVPPAKGFSEKEDKRPPRRTRKSLATVITVRGGRYLAIFLVLWNVIVWHYKKVHPWQVTYVAPESWSTAQKEKVRATNTTKEVIQRTHDDLSSH